MNDALVSVIVPVYNAGKYIEQCIASVLGQSYKKLELILVDDGSEDNSLSLCRLYDNDERVKILQQKNSGAPAARNKGIDYCTGVYVMFLDADDYLTETALESLVSAMEDGTSDLIIGNCTEVDAEGLYIKDKPVTPKFSLKEPKYDCYTCDPYPGNKLYRTELIKNNKIYFGNVRIGQDMNFYYKYLAFSRTPVFVDDYVAIYRILDNSISRKISFNIFDIVKSFDDVLEFYKDNRLYDEVVETLFNSLKIIHYNTQVKKARHFSDKNDKKKIVAYFYRYIDDISNRHMLVDKLFVLKVRLKKYYLLFR